MGVVRDRLPRRENLKVGCDVIAPIPNKPLMHSGRVKRVTIGGCEVQFDNGALHEVSFYDLRLMRVPKKEGKSISEIILTSQLSVRFTVV